MLETCLGYLLQDLIASHFQQNTRRSHAISFLQIDYLLSFVRNTHLSLLSKKAKEVFTIVVIFPTFRKKQLGTVIVYAL